MNEADVLKALCRERLDPFTCKAFGLIEPASSFEYNWHIGCIAEHLEAVWNNEIQYLIINMPPRSLKTHTTSVAFPAWGMGKNPAIRFMLTSFKSSLAEKMTRKTRMIMRSEWYKETFPNTRISEELDRQYYFETTEHGQYFSSSMSSVTGEGCDIQICDDPISPDEALSDTVRESTNETIRGTLFSRFNDPRTGRFIMNMQRLHDDDPTGNLLKEQGWHLLKLPAEAKGKSHSIVLKDKEWLLKENELLFSARFTKDVLDKARERLGEYNYAGQYLQEPVPIGGGLLKPEWVRFYTNGSIKPKEMNVAILVDPSGGEDVNRKKQKLSDWTAMMVVGLANDNNYYLLDIVRDRLNPTDRIDTLFMLHRKWNELCGKPPKVGYEKISMQSDTHYIKEKQKLDAYHFPMFEVGGTMKKEARIERLVPDMQNGRWYFPQSLLYVDIEGRRFDLVQEILTAEMPTFPRARFDDMLDALSRIYEPVLSMVFPKPKVGMVEKARRQARTPEIESWKSF